MQGGGMPPGGGGYGGPPSGGGPGGYGPPSGGDGSGGGGGGFPPPQSGGGYGQQPQQGGPPPNQYGAPQQVPAGATQLAAQPQQANPYQSPQQGYGPPGGQYPQGQYMQPGQSRGGEYEFTPEEDFAIGDLSKKMSFVGLMGIIFGVLLILGGLGSCVGNIKAGGGNGFGNVIQGVFALIVGIWTRSAAQSFQNIVTTQGSDIMNLMGALAHLRKIYGLQKVLYIILIVLVALAFVFGILAVFLLASRSVH